jgi:hypothetical protein
LNNFKHQVRYYKKPSIAWLNLRWLVSEGIDISDPTAVDVFEKRIIERYAFGKPTEDQNEEDFLPLQETEVTDTLDIVRIKNTHSLEVKNLSFLKLKTSVFKRNLNGLLKKISNTEHSLKRIYIE